MSRPPSIFEDPVGSTPVEAARASQPVDSACPRCGAPLRADQEWCLNCGTAVSTRVAGTPGWRTPLALVASVLAIALAGLVAAFLAVSNDPDRVAQLPPSAAQQAAPASPTPAPAPPAPTPEADAISPDTIPPATGGDQPPGDEDPPAPSPGSSAVGTWPAGESAWTVVLLSSPSRAAANRRARELGDGGTEVGVLESGDFKSLRSGYFVVFSGQYEAQDSAEQALSRLRSGAPQAYVRRVTPR